MALRLADVFDVWRLLCDMIKDPQVARNELHPKTWTA